jgi:hypothetical protein
LLAVAVLAVGLWNWHAGSVGPKETSHASNTSSSSKTSSSFDCDVMLRNDGLVVVTPRGEARPSASAVADAGSAELPVPAAVSAWPAGSAPPAAMTCLRSRESKEAPEPPQAAATGLGLYLGLSLLFAMLGLPLLVTTLLSEDAAGKVVSTTRVVVYALVTCVVVNFVRRMFDGGEVGDIAIDKWLAGLAGVGIAGKVAQSFNEK